MANVTVRVKINQSEIRRILDRSKTELWRWAKDVGIEIDRKTPEDTGELIASRTVPQVQVDGDRNVAVWWYWRAPHAPIVEDAWGGQAQPRLPGRIAPFAEPTIRKAAKELAGPVKRAFEA